MVIAAYLQFAASLLAFGLHTAAQPQMAIAAGLTAAAFALLAPRRRHPPNPEARLARGLASGSGDMNRCLGRPSDNEDAPGPAQWLDLIRLLRAREGSGPGRSRPRERAGRWRRWSTR
jgi:hypothetical protein